MCALYYYIHYYIHSRSRQPEPSTCSSLEESLRINCVSNHARLLRSAQSAPVILSEVRIVHEQWPVDIRKKSVLHVPIDDVAHATIQILSCGVNCSVGACEEVGEVKLDNDVVVGCFKVHQILQHIIRQHIFIYLGLYLHLQVP